MCVYMYSKMPASSRLFQKAGRDAQRLFQKADKKANGFFTKAGGAFKDLKNDAPAILHDVGSGLGSASHVMRDISKEGGKIVTAINHSPFGPLLVPVTAPAGLALNA